MKMVLILILIAVSKTVFPKDENLTAIERVDKIKFLKKFEKSLYFFTKDDLISFNDTLSYLNFIDTNKVEGIEDETEFSFSERTLVILSYNGVDCHSKFRFNLLKDDESKTYDISISIIYGGCRAGGRYFNEWISIPKVPSGYKLITSTYILDNESEEVR